jgi:hypothetical protein
MLKPQKRNLILVAVALVIALGLVAVAGRTITYAQGSTCDPNNHSGMMGGRGNGGMMGGMMGGSTVPQNCPFGSGGMMGGMGMMGSRGMMGGMMSGMMGRQGMMGGSFGPGRGMMGAWTPPADLAPAAGKSVTVDQAAYVTAWNNKTSLKLNEIMQFDNHFYGEAVEVDTGRGAFEFLIDPDKGVVYAEPGPNMMWNLRYGMMNNGMMGTPTEDGSKMTISAEQAIKNAQVYLDKALPGAKAEDKALAFYGYYTLDFLHDGKIVGMLSVNGYTGQVWLHQWHGSFVGETSQ